jgi:hypothetical protein
VIVAFGVRDDRLLLILKPDGDGDVRNFVGLEPR